MFLSNQTETNWLTVSKVPLCCVLKDCASNFIRIELLEHSSEFLLQETREAHVSFYKAAPSSRMTSCPNSSNFCLLQNFNDPTLIFRQHVCACVFVSASHAPCSPHRLRREDLTQVLPVTTADAHVSSALPTRVSDCRCLCMAVYTYVYVHAPARCTLARLDAPIRPPGTRVMCASVFAQQPVCIVPSKLAVLLQSDTY